MVGEQRTTVYNNITSKEKMKKVNPKNLELEKDFLEYLASANKSKETIKQYKANLHVFWCWNLEFNSNKFYVDLKKRELVKFQTHAICIWGWSSRRLRTVKATLSSLGNYVANILDDEFEDFRPIVSKIESPVDKPVREKSVFQEEELERLMKHLVDNGEFMKACAISLAMNSGRRKAELLRFKIGYFRPQFMICSGALYRTPEMVQTKGPGEEGKPLTLYTLAAPFQPYLDLWIKERRRLGINSQWLFPRCVRGKWLDEQATISTLDSWVHEFSEFLGKPFYWHSLRHFFNTKLVSYGIPTQVIQDLIGWESADMVTRYDDTEKDDRFEKYFGAIGIKRVQPTTLDEI